MPGHRPSTLRKLSMRNIVDVHNATVFNTEKPGMQFYRVIGSLDMNRRGVEHSIADIDPFIFLDDALIEGDLSSVFHKHPHAGLAAVTYLLEGTARAWDNIHGASPRPNQAGGVYCLHAGRGVVHGEAPYEGIKKIRLLQMWFNLGIDALPLPMAQTQLYEPSELPVFQDDHGMIWTKHWFSLWFELPRKEWMADTVSPCQVCRSSIAFISYF